MSQPFEALKISDKVYWVGAVDRDLPDFHGYATPGGSTYNAYLVVDEKIVLIDTVKKKFFSEMMRRISSVIDPAKIDIIVSNHSEMDHTGALPETTAAVKPEKILASKMGVKALGRHFPRLQVEAVKNGETLKTGSFTLTFLETRMLHWPDSMVTYIPESKLLFSQDIMGMHFATGHLFAEDNSEERLYFEAAKYYANIVAPYSPIVEKTLKKLTAAGVAPEIVAPDHGVVWKGSEWVGKIFSWYKRWAEQKPTKKAVVVYSTMWNSTALLAKAIGEGLKAGGCKPVVMAPLSTMHRSDVAEELLDAGALLVGSPTINSQLFPTVADVLAYIRGLKFKNLVGGAFGSYGWSGEALGQVREALQAMNIDIVGTVKSLYIPGDEELNAAYDLGLQVAKKLS